MVTEIFTHTPDTISEQKKLNEHLLSKRANNKLGKNKHIKASIVARKCMNVLLFLLALNFYDLSLAQ